MVVCAAIWTAYSNEGGGMHVYDLSMEEKLHTTRLNWISQPFVVMSFVTGKAAVGFLILRILGPATWQKPFLYFVMGSCALISVVDVVLTFVQCTPVQKLWDTNTPGHCWAPETQAHYALFTSCTYSPEPPT